MPEKPPCNLCNQALTKYNELKQRLHNYMFNNKQLKISYNEGIESYTAVYNLIDKNGVAKLQNQKIFEPYASTFSKIFKQDLTKFSKKVRHNLAESKGMTNPQNQLSLYYQWTSKYTRFLFWTKITFNIIEKNHKVYSKSTLNHEGLLIFKQEVIVPLYDNIFKLIVQNLEAFKQDSLQEYYELQFMIRFIGMCGYSKYKSVVLEKGDMDQFQFYSRNNQSNQKSEIQYQTDFFQKNFTPKMVEFLDQKYKTISEKMIKLSTPEYVERATQLLAQQQKAADYFYPPIKVKNLIIRAIEQILIMQRSEELMTKQKTGLFALYQIQDSQSLKCLYKLVKRTSQQKLYSKYFQLYIQKRVTQILGKLTPQQQKQAKKQIVKEVINQLFEFYIKVENITTIIHNNLKDSQDLILFESLKIGFQHACNKNNTVCNFLVYYADNILKKQDSNIQSYIDTVQNNTAELVVKVAKLMKLLHSLDAFLKLYQRTLGVRILYDNFKNRNAEIEIINLLRNQVGVSSMNKINSMIQDLKYSEQFNAQYNNVFKANLSYAFYAMILTSGSWEITDHKNGKKLVPPQLGKAVDLYQKYYHETFPGKQITWVFNYGRAITMVKFDNNCKYILMLNNYQLLILLHLQRIDFKNLQIGELINEIKPEDQPAFVASIFGLLKKGILKKTGNTPKPQKTDIIIFNKGFTSKVQKIGCFQIPRFTEKASNMGSQLAGDRAVIIQASIVKLMKSKRVLHYNEIIPQVIKMCKNFKAQIALIKKQIQNLIHKQFLERDEKDLNTLIYKP